LGKDDRLMLAALGFSATSTIALAAVLLAFAVTGGISLLGGQEEPLATVSAQGVTVKLYRMGVTDSICVENDGVLYVYSAPEGSLAYIVLEVEVPRGAAAVISSATLETPAGTLQPAKPLTVHSESCDASVRINGVEPYVGGSYGVEGGGRVIVAFPVEGGGAPRSGTVSVELLVDGRAYTAEIVIEKCSIAEARIGVRRPG